MEDRTPTIEETVASIRSALQEYVQAAYHVGHPQLVRQREDLLQREGVLFRAPYIESTPRYQAGPPFAELGISAPARTLLTALAERHGDRAPLLHDPPYIHQTAALEATSDDRVSIVVTTGTGSGKTETFLLPILAKLADEAATRPASFATPAMRALLLYPMNALVNDQLGRLRLLFGDPRVTAQFDAWAGRPARFARYTSRTLYPGVRGAKKDARRLKPVERFYLSLLDQAEDSASPHHEQAAALISNLQQRGKWPSKPDLRRWYGKSGTRWQNSSGEFVRAVLGADDPELLTRHEVLASPPDVLITNYSMLEYMLMRPLERPIFDATRAWLTSNPDERLLVVIDEAHLYRGAAGAEVGLLLRRLRSRLGVTADRLQVICTSASFSDAGHAKTFAAQLSGKLPAEFRTLRGQLALRPDEGRGSQEDALVLSEVPLDMFYGATNESRRRDAVSAFLTYREIEPNEEPTSRLLYRALAAFAPMSRLVNLTMQEAAPLHELGPRLFDTEDHQLASRAMSALVALGSAARRAEGEPGLLPCRVHTFFRGLPGLWACMDASCPISQDDYSGGPVGALYSQPRASCECGARVFELYTCRNCGAAYARAYTDDLAAPTFLWHEPGGGFFAAAGQVLELLPVDLLLEEPTGVAEPADLDLETGRLNPTALGERVRTVFLRTGREDINHGDDDAGARRVERAGEFNPCGVCNTSAGYGRSSVQDHQTKGDQPFQALVTEQIAVQPPSRQAYSDFAPLRGRKVLVFSDSRQTAARLAPNLQRYSMQDVLRPLIVRGWQVLQSVDVLAPSLGLEDLYLAVLVGAHEMSVRLRPELKGVESLHAMREVTAALNQNALSDPAEVFQIRQFASEPPPQSLLRGMVESVTDRNYGLQALALASLCERKNITARIYELPELAGIAVTDSEKVGLTRLWLGQWATPTAGIWFTSMTLGWWKTTRGVRPHSGKFAALSRWFADGDARRAFERDWLPRLLELFCEPVENRFRMRAASLALELGGPWGYCQACRTTQRRVAGTTRCINCARDRVIAIDPDEDLTFRARKGYYRASARRALEGSTEPPMAIVASEHTAQLNAAQADEVFSKAEEHELLFQDLDIGLPGTGDETTSAIDVLSCTTTMEVGIDIGTLSGVALRNMPPSRASYQQRAGRAGRRGDSVATVVAFGSADSHDEHYFGEPDAMIRGNVTDPVLVLDNPEIARRHVTAYLLQRYHQARLPDISPEAQPQLFEVLGTVEGFLTATSPLNREDFGNWLDANEDALRKDVGEWLPNELAPNDRVMLLAGLATQTLDEVDRALEGVSEGEHQGPSTAEGEAEETVVVEVRPEENEEQASPQRTAENLLDRLLYKGVLPRYAFPTDVVSFHVFDRERSSRFRTEYKYSPSQGLPTALTQYAPGKEVWIDGKLWFSGALYSPMPGERFHAWETRRLYFECEICTYALTRRADEAERGEREDCPACGSTDSFGAAKYWLRPPGFAHPVGMEEDTSSEDQPARSYATRAKLVAPGPGDPEKWEAVTPRIRQYHDRTHLLVTNSGPRREGYTYCTRCGLIEPTAVASPTVTGTHPKPYPDEKAPTCPGAVTRGLVLGTDFISDVLLVGLKVDDPVTLRPELLATQVALRTVAEGITIAAAKRLEIEVGDLQAEFRPALTPGGRRGMEAEIYIYDTLAGGAGFAHRVGEMGTQLFNDTISLLEDCPDGCDRSCYRCLRGFSNRFEHDLLDRYVGASLLRYLVDGDEPLLAARRIDQSTVMLHADLARHGLTSVDFVLGAPVDVPGIGVVTAPLHARSESRQAIVAVHSPLTPDYLPYGPLREAKEYGGVPVILVDELVVSRNLPAASKAVIEAVS